MLSNRSELTEAATPDQGLIPDKYDTTISGGSALLSVVAIWLAVSGHFRTKRLEKEAWFEKSFGEDLRLAVRKLDKSGDLLNAFVYKSAKGIAELQDEFSGILADVEEAASDIRAILREVDLSERVKGEDWENQFIEKFNEIEELLNGAQDLTNDVLLSRVAQKAKERTHRLVRELRKKIERVRFA